MRKREDHGSKDNGLRRLEEGQVYKLLQSLVSQDTGDAIRRLSADIASLGISVLASFRSEVSHRDDPHGTGAESDSDQPLLVITTYRWLRSVLGENDVPIDSPPPYNETKNRNSTVNTESATSPNSNNGPANPDATNGPPIDPVNSTSYDDISRREGEILRLVATGKSTREIAESLFISPRTVSKHRENLMRKLSVGNAAAMVARAVALGICRPEDERN